MSYHVDYHCDNTCEYHPKTLAYFFRLTHVVWVHLVKVFVFWCLELSRCCLSWEIPASSILQLISVANVEEHPQPSNTHNTSRYEHLKGWLNVGHETDLLRKDLHIFLLWPFRVCVCVCDIWLLKHAPNMGSTFSLSSGWISSFSLHLKHIQGVSNITAKPYHGFARNWK